MWVQIAIWVITTVIGMLPPRFANRPVVEAKSDNHPSSPLPKKGGDRDP